jgi:hypothetical protein
MVPFSKIRLNEMFICNGNVYFKASSRTAVMVSNMRTFYMSQNDRCSI